MSGVVVEVLSGMIYQQQAIKIADQYEGIANQYDPLENSNLSLPPITDGSLPQFDPEEVYNSLLMIKTTTTTLKLWAKIRICTLQNRLSRLIY